MSELMDADAILILIEEKTVERRKVFRDAVLGKKLDKIIAKLYEDLRLARVGTTVGDRTTIVKRARIERELEKLFL